MLHTTYLAVFAFFVLALGQNCDKQGILLYEDLACQVKTKDSSCPTSYDCKDLNVSNRCVVRGKTYKNQEHIRTDSTERLTCEFGCFCNSNNNSARVFCAQGFCAGWLPQSQPPPGCHKGYTLEKCCPLGDICPPFNDTTTCAIDGVEYKAGERFAPKDSCYTCICQKGFTGKYEAPYCKRRGCDSQLKYQTEVQKFCAPVYIEKYEDKDVKCCPAKWTCPDGSEKFETAPTNFDASCKYGEKSIRVGDSFEKVIQHSFKPLKIKCQCNIPPLLTCYKN